MQASPAPIIQIFGFNDCQDTRKAQRFFAERRLTVHFVNMKERPPSKGELRRFVEKFGAPALLDKDGPRYRALGLHVSGDSPQRVLARAETEPRSPKRKLRPSPHPPNRCRRRCHAGSIRVIPR